MKTLFLIFLTILLSCEKPESEPDPILTDDITGYWIGQIFIGGVSYPIEFYLSQTDMMLGGYFIPPISSDLTNIESSSSYENKTVTIIVFDEKTDWNYVFSGIKYSNKIIGDYQLIICNELYTGVWIVEKQIK
jgi:hypothetical protein